jgi:membrane-bound lytic murein transglycosylase D
VIPVPAGKSRVVAASNAATRAPAPQRDHVRYRIRPGDTLSSIAEEHGTTVQKLKAWNGIKGTRITAGAVLRIYTDSSRD